TEARRGHRQDQRRSRAHTALICANTLPFTQESVMALQLGDEAPDFTAETTEGKVQFHNWIANSWAVLFSHPKDFTPVCTTELGRVAALKPEFDKRGVKVIGLSVDPL